jgi:separase
MPSTIIPAEVVRKAIATPSSCPPTTPATLQSLLAPTQDAHPKPPKTPAKTTTTRKPPLTRTTRAKPAPSAVVEVTHTLAVQERYKLATDVVNVSLKVLNDATKASTSSPSQSPITKKSAQSGLTAVAECARIAFAHLRSARPANDESLQLETGMLALSSKLVALGMDMLAMKELRILKTCIQRESEGASPTPSSEKETLATLLHLECNTSDVKVLSLAISYHMTVLRLIVNSGRPATIEASLPHVLLDNPISAAALVLRSVELSKDRKKAAKQLDTLSKLVLSMCPSPSSTADHTSDPKTHASPDIAFRLQTTALLIQTKWWPLAGHKANLQKEIHEPLVRYVDAYRRRAQDQGPLAYKQAIECISALVELDKLGSTPSTLSTALYKSLSALAESFGLQDEALRYNAIMSSTSNNVSGSDMSLHCTIRSMALSLDRDDHPDLTMLRNQVSSCKTQLGDNLTPTASSVDEMSIELAKLRKITTKLLTQESKTQSGSVLDQRGLVLCTISFLCTEILLWCLQRVTGGESSESVGSRLLVPFVSSSILSCRLLVTSYDHVVTVHNVLETCTRLLDVKPDPEAEHLVVNISNLHWRCFQLSASSIGELSPQALLCLQASVDILRDRASVHQDAGFLASKLEKLGSIAKSCSIFGESIQVQLRSGVLRELTHTASLKPLSVATQLDQKAQLLRRNLHEYHASAAKDSASTAFFDDGSLDSLERATLLEIQLAFFEEHLFKPSHRRRIAADLQCLCVKLLELYTEDDYPLRRARVCTRVLKYTNEFPGLVDDKTTEFMMTSGIVPDSLYQDTGLKAFASYLDISLSLAQALHSNETSIEEVKLLMQKLTFLLKSLDTWKAIIEEVDDVDALISELLFAVSFFAVKGQDYPRLEALETLSQIHHLRPTPEPSSILSISAQLGLQYLHLGYSSKACRILEREVHLLSQTNVPTMAKLEWHLAQTEVFTTLGQANTAAKSMASATEFMRSFPAVDYATKAQAQIIRARFSFVCSLYSRSIGQVKQAMIHAKRYVLSCQQTMSFLELQHAPQDVASSSSTTASQDELVNAVHKLIITDSNGVSSSELEPATNSGAAFSAVLPDLLNSFLHLAETYAHQGLSTEASYYLEQAEALVVRVGVPELRTKILVQREAQAYIEGIEIDNPAADSDAVDSIDLVRLGIVRGDIFAADEETWDNAQQEYEKAETMANRLASKNFIEKLEALKVQPDKLIKTAPIRANKRVLVKTPASKVQPAKMSKVVNVKAKGTNATNVSVQEDVPLASLCAAVLRQRGLLLVDQGETDLGLELLERADSMKHDSTQDILQQLAMAEGLLRKFGDELALDFTFNVLPESTISFPALSATTGKKPSTQTLLSSTPMSFANTTTPKKTSKQKRTDDDFARFLCDAQERLVSIQRRSASTAGMSVFHQVCGLGSKAMLLLSALNASMSLSGTLHPTRVACSIEMSRIEAFSREMGTIEAEKEYSSHGLDIQVATQDHNGHLSAARFQKEYVDIIPSSWTTVSLTLSEDHNELYIVRYRANQAPFLLRLPMTRNKMQDIEEDEESPTFDYESGKAELQEIIELSNYSCSKPPSAMTQETKQSWWEEREALDLRMQELIINIENIWLGGFKGVLSQHRKDSGLLARFRKSLDGILDRHLPSRQGTKSKTKKLVLDSNIIELFVGLGDDHDGEVDMDEQVLDLLYFVIDILQFNGERNAYDEVDFDVMATETMDALRSYHEAANFNEAEQNHLILILDRKLHAFPWESLPCLQNVSVSRVGSILTLRERILAMRRQMKDSTEERYIVSKHSGAFILNPSGDLSRTQTTMSPLFDSLQKSTNSSWQSTINKIPSEKDFATALSDKSMLLYFGHGSGNQYIRNRTIKKLDKCAEVVWLMGCSSGRVTEHGDYEPTSVPLSYLVAGKRLEHTDITEEETKYRNDNREGLCMAIVATLWDVTDKDIDRFAVEVGEHWGLWSSAPVPSPRELAPPKTPRKRGRSVPKTPSKTPSRTPGGRSRSRLVMRDEEVMRPKSLSEAVMLGRDACNLRYLNGAATVVYGIPVYLGS